MPRASNFWDWESRCLYFARQTYCSSPSYIPSGHVFTLTANTRACVPPEKDDNLHQAYLDILFNVRRSSLDGGSVHAPPERQPDYNDAWQQIFRSCAGRRYFSTEGGRVGIGPSNTQRGDRICVFYGSPPVILLRAAGAEKGASWSLIRNAFVHGFMELSEVPLSARAEDESFIIIYTENGRNASRTQLNLAHQSGVALP